MKKYYLFFAFLIMGLIIAGCNKEDEVTGPGDNNNEYPADPIISKIFPSVAIANGYIYVEGQNFGQTASNISVVFKSNASGQEKQGTIEEVIQTKITVRVPGDIDTTSQGNTILVTTPKGTVEDNSTTVYGIETSAFGDSLLAGKGLIGSVYQLEPNTPNLPNFDTMQVKSVLLAPNLDVPTRSFSDGFPGVQGGLVEWFGIKFVGKIIIPADGEYTFTTGSDDGSILYIDGNEVLDNDGTHAYREASGSINLSQGEHTIRVDYFQGPRYSIALRLFWTKPGGTREIVPAESINLPDNF